MYPESLNTFPSHVQNLYKETYTKSRKTQDEDVASKVAWAIVKGKIKKTDKGFVARSEDFAVEELYSIELTIPNEQLIQRDANGDGFIELDLPLASLMPHEDGWQNTELVLRSFEEQINQTGIVGDFDHVLFKNLKSKFKTEQVVSMMKEKKGIAKSVSAYIKDGVLRLKMSYDKRYTQLLNDVKGLSLEALYKLDKTNKKFIGGQILGFTFSRTRPADTGVRVAS